MEAAQIKVAGLEMSRRMARSIAHAGMSNVLVMGRDAKAIAASMSSDGAWAPGLEDFVGRSQDCPVVVQAVVVHVEEIADRRRAGA